MPQGTRGWTLRWQIDDGRGERVRLRISRVGNCGTGELSIVVPNIDQPTTPAVARAAVASDLRVDSDSGTSKAKKPCQDV